MFYRKRLEYFREPSFAAIYLTCTSTSLLISGSTNMSTKTPLLLIAAMSVIFGLCSLFAAEAQVLTATTIELTASDLASVLGVRTWSYRLCFEKPVEGITVRLCELRRQPDGSWKQATLAGGHGFYEHESIKTSTRNYRY